MCFSGSTSRCEDVQSRYLSEKTERQQHPSNTFLMKMSGHPRSQWINSVQGNDIQVENIQALEVSLNFVYEFKIEVFHTKMPTICAKIFEIDPYQILHSEVHASLSQILSSGSSKIHKNGTVSRVIVELERSTQKPSRLSNDCDIATKSHSFY